MNEEYNTDYLEQIACNWVIGCQSPEEEVYFNRWYGTVIRNVGVGNKGMEQRMRALKSSMYNEIKKRIKKGVTNSCKI